MLVSVQVSGLLELAATMLKPLASLVARYIELTAAGSSVCCMRSAEMVRHRASLALPQAQPSSGEAFGHQARTLEGLPASAAGSGFGQMLGSDLGCTAAASERLASGRLVAAGSGVKVLAARAICLVSS